jgi:hypothetical protein
VVNQYQALWFVSQLFPLTKFVRFFSEFVSAGVEAVVKKVLSLDLKEMLGCILLKTRLILGKH